MSVSACLAAATVGYPHGGGHRWVYLNWALGLRAAGCELTWIEEFPDDLSPDDARSAIDALLADLHPFGLDERVEFVAGDSGALADAGGRPLERALGCELLVNLRYGLPDELVAGFARSALVDIDPGLTQLWLSRGEVHCARHDLYFTTGENVGPENPRIPSCGIDWLHVPPCVALDQWTPKPAAADAPYSTVSHWWPDVGGDWIEFEGEWIDNSKREGFADLLDVPRSAPAPLELALGGIDDVPEELDMLRSRGWRVCEAWRVAANAASYRDYVRGSRGELSAAKPSTVLLQPGWVSDRTLCYLASGKPAIVRHTGPSRFLPEADGLFRFHDAAGALTALEAAEADYERHSASARRIAEQHFDAARVAARLLDHALG